MVNKNVVLIVDDTEINRSLLADMLNKHYVVLEASNGAEAVSIIQKLHEEISLVLLDIVMPCMDGFEVLENMKRNGWINDVPVITISSETSSGYIYKAYDLGATDYISRPFDENTVLRRVENTIMLYSKQKMLAEMVSAQICEKEQNNILMVEILSNIVEFRNGESGQHVLNIRKITELLLRKLKQISNKYDLSEENISLMSNASSLHDIGKISIPDNILNKPGRLTADEFEIMKTHCEIGAQILKNTPNRQSEKLTQAACDICKWHHERYDGKGYPDGLVGEQIPISAQVVSLADVYDALTHARIYKPAYSHEKSMNMILGGKCGMFNPLLLTCLSKIDTGSLLDYSDVHCFDATQRKPVLPTEEIQVSTRTLLLLEQERVKYKFFVSLSNEIQFEYSEHTDVLTLSECGASKLNINEIIAHPLNNSEFMNIFHREDYIDLHDKLIKAVPENPVVSEIYQLTVNGIPRWHKVVARPLWLEEERELLMTSVIGKFFDIHDEYIELISFKQRAEQDSLTDLQNHKTARNNIEAALGIHNKKYAMMLLDLDDFKLANDRFGHLFGDNVLKFVARKILKQISMDEVAARIGGDEFLVFLQYTDDLENRVSQIFESLSFSKYGFDCTISIGVACFPEYGTDYESLFHCADRALYAAKRSGKNCFRFFDHTIEKELSNISPIKYELTT